MLRCQEVSIDDAWVGAGVFVVAGVFPEALAAIVETFFDRRPRRVVTGLHWSLAACGLIFAALLAEITRLGRLGTGDVSTCLELVFFLAGVFFIWVFQLSYCRKLPRWRASNNLCFLTTAWLVNSSGLVCLAGAVLYLVVHSVS